MAYHNVLKNEITIDEEMIAREFGSFTSRPHSFLPVVIIDTEEFGRFYAFDVGGTTLVMDALPPHLMGADEADSL